MAEDLSRRLCILKEGGVLSEKNFERVSCIIAHFSDRHGIELTEENASAFITHLCSALERISGGEPVVELDSDIYEDVIIHPMFQQASKISGELKQMYQMIPESELMYLNMHLNVLLEVVQD